MSAFNGAGTFVISGVGLPFVTGTTISSTVANQLNNDLAAGLTNCITKDGQSTPIANIPMGGFKFTNVGPPTAPGDVLVQGSPISVSDVTITGNKNPNEVLIGPAVAPAAPPTWRVLAPEDIPAGAKTNANKIINGDFRIDQRFGGVQWTMNGAATQKFGPDRWQAVLRTTAGLNSYSVQRYSSGAPYPLSLRIQVLTAGVFADPVDYTGINYAVEGYDFQEALFGNATAKPLTLSFIVNANIAGTYGVAFRNSPGTRYFCATYTVNVANAWETKTIAIPGDVGGVPGDWDTATGAALKIFWDLGTAATSSKPVNAGWQAGLALGVTGVLKPVQNSVGAVWVLANVKLEMGTAATPFVPDIFEVSWAKCQRYYQKRVADLNSRCFANGTVYSATNGGFAFEFVTQMRAPPTFSAGGNFANWNAGGGLIAATPTQQGIATDGCRIDTISSGLVAGNATALVSNSDSSAFLAFDAEI